jgi:DNA-binding LytR/AlgR family response regulator
MMPQPDSLPVKPLINCIVIDDEPLARAGVKEYIADIDFLFLAGEFGNPLAASHCLSTTTVDLIFLDIQMPKISGIEFMKSLPHPPAVIFTTAYPQYALESFDVNALDYLVKPVSFDRFLKACFKARAYCEMKNNAGKIVSAAAAVDSKEAHFFIKTDNKIVKIALDDILFVEAMQNYVTIQTTDKKYMSYLTTKSVEDFLPADRFIKVHKSFIVSAGRVDSIEGNEICIGKYRLPMSRSLKEEVTEKLLNGKFLKR